MTDRTHTVFLSLLLACAVSVAAAPESFPPQKPDPMPEFYIPAAGAALDEQWVFIDTLFDAAANRPDLFSAYPVELVFSKSGRGYLAMLHTVFRTVTYGESWSNLDLAPPPAVNLTWEAVRSPAYIYGIGLRYTTTTASEGDSLFLAVVNGDAELGHVRLIRDIGGAMSLWTFPQLSMNRWITEVASSEHNSAVAFAGLDGRIYRQHIQTTLWDTLDYNFFGSWIDDVEVVGARIIAAGSHFIISEDNGVTWEAFPTADPTGVRDLSFAPDGLHGLACGETEIGDGWVRYTEDGGTTWSERTLTTIDPLHAVKMISATVGFAGGGDVNNASGRIHRTSDGGRTWEIELLCNADIRAISSSRRSAAYVFAVAAGVFPDFSCGVWRSRVFSPAPDGPVLAAFPDTLDFGLIEVNHTDTLAVTLRNIGNDTITATGVSLVSAEFNDLWDFQSVEFAPNDEFTFDFVYAPDDTGEHSAIASIINDQSDNIQVFLYGRAGIEAVDPRQALLPEVPTISVWPNPGNAEFNIRYELSGVQNISLVIYDLSGREVTVLEKGLRAAGEYRLNWNGAKQASGLYFVRLETQNGARVTKKLMLVK